MERFFIWSLFILFTLSLNTSFAEIIKGKWNFVKESDYCYIGSSPINSDISEDKKRGDVYILVYRINNNPDAIVQVNSGYPYKVEEPVIVKIDKKNYEFYSEEDSAWTQNDKAVIYAMQKGLDLVVTGTSSRGTKTNDFYTLSGFTKAYKKLNNDC